MGGWIERDTKCVGSGIAALATMGVAQACGYIFSHKHSVGTQSVKYANRCLADFLGVQCLLEV